MNSKYVVGGVLLAVAFILNWATPLYNRVSPELGGLPFFYWWQTLVLVAVTFLYIGYSYAVRERGEEDEGAGSSPSSASSGGSTGGGAGSSGGGGSQ